LIAAILDLAKSREVPSEGVSNAFTMDRISKRLRHLTMEVYACSGLDGSGAQR
jgi:hypothetical protein